MEKRDKKIPYEVVIQERKRVDLYGNVVYYIYWFDKYGNDITNEWKFWSKGPKKKYDRVNRYNKAFVPYRPIKETQDLPIDAKHIPLLTRIFGKNILAEIGGGKIFITTGKYAVNFWCWTKTK